MKRSESQISKSCLKDRDSLQERESKRNGCFKKERNQRLMRLQKSVQECTTQKELAMRGKEGVLLKRAKKRTKETEKDVG